MFSAKFLPDGKHIIAPSGRDEISIIDIESGGVVKRLPAETLDQIILSSDGKTFAEIGWYTIRMIDLNDDHLLIEIPLWDSIKKAAISPNAERLIVTGWDDKITVWDLKTGKPAHYIEYSSKIINLEFLPARSDQDEDRLVSGDFNGRVRVWEIGQPNEEKMIEMDSQGSGQLATSPDGGSLATMDGDTTAWIWDTSTWKKIGQIHYPCGSGGSTAILFHPDQRSVILGCDGQIWVYDTKTWEIILKSKGWFPDVLQNGRVIARFPTEGEQANTPGTAKPGINFWDIDTHETVLSLPMEPQEEGIVAVGPYTISADNHYLAAITDAWKIYVWDTVSNKLLYKLGDLNLSYLNPGFIAFHPYYPILATPGSRGTVKLWDMETGKLLRTLKVTDGDVTNVAFSQDGRWLAAGASDGAVRVWGLGE